MASEQVASFPSVDNPTTLPVLFTALVEQNNHARMLEVLIALEDDFRAFRSDVIRQMVAHQKAFSGVTGHESLDTQSAMGKFFFTLTAALAEMERGLIGERTRTALARKKERGEKTGGHVPYGFDAIGGNRVDNPQEKRISAHIGSLREGGMSYQKIADFLNREGIPTKKGSAWTAMQVCRVVKAA